MSGTPSTANVKGPPERVPASKTTGAGVVSSSSQAIKTRPKAASRTEDFKRFIAVVFKIWFKEIQEVLQKYHRDVKILYQLKYSVL
jgi:hypothetical protein